ncbi:MULTISPECIES: fumarylacetoacetate hydrolase family protein [unclassified Streptomyces]|uniref:fumarylacetoacetate hydrolase family protein n=1 Tax=unclassified Streptomyces TaxID=2593676 RepID=UPI003D8B0575
MKFVSYSSGGTASFGRLLDDDRIVDLADAIEGVTSLREALAADCLAELGRVDASTRDQHALAGVTLLPVVPDPLKILCVGLNYRSHREETSRPAAEHPTIFPRYADSQTGQGGPLLKPAETEEFDYEGELAVVIGRPGRRISRTAALNHVAGYSVYNDGSVRDWQRHTSQFMPGKNFPSTGAFGPALVTPDEVGELTELTLTTSVNGEERQRASIGDLIFDVATLIEYVSTFTPLSAGDVIVTGTPAGVGLFREPPTFLQVGDKVEVHIDRVGTLVNVVADDGA